MQFRALWQQPKDERFQETVDTITDIDLNMGWRSAEGRNEIKMDKNRMMRTDMEFCVSVSHDISKEIG